MPDSYARRTLVVPRRVARGPRRLTARSSRRWLAKAFEVDEFATFLAAAPIGVLKFGVGEGGIRAGNDEPPREVFQLL